MRAGAGANAAPVFNGGAMMSIFDEEAKKMAEEAADAARRSEQTKAKLQETAYKIYSDLQSYLLANHLQNDVEAAIQDNVVTLRRKTTSNFIAITCTKNTVSPPEKAFSVQMEKKLIADVGERDMARWVLKWIADTALER